MRTYPTDLSANELIRQCDYVAKAERQFPNLLTTCLSESPSMPPFSELDGVDAVMSALRQYRTKASIHALWQDLTGQIDIATLGQRLSNIARNCLGLALASAEHEVSKLHGELIGEDGQPVALSIIGMGKLGGDELNFNSDIDVVLTYRTQAKATGPRHLEAGQYLSLVSQGLIQRLETITSEGRVWVVDTRLRPFGSTGALVWSLRAMEAYFVSEGRTWERYAWLKASHAAGDVHTAGLLLKNLKPFIYRRYLDYGIFESLRALHEKIDGQSQQQGGHLDIKRGPGGIRALEFLVQSLQLLEGGRTPECQQTGFLPALDALENLGHLDATTAKTMREAYGFLRTLENRLQALTGQQTHRLPTAGPDLDRLAQLMGMSSASVLMTELNAHRDWVASEFQSRFLDQTEHAQPKFAWPPSADFSAQLKAQGMGHDAADEMLGALEQLATRLAKRPLSREGRLRLDRFMPQLIGKIIHQRHPSLGLKDILSLIERIAQRSAYLALLYERPEITDQVIKAFRASERMARWVIDSPQLLDDLIDPQHGLVMPTPPTVDADDPETSLNQLGRWRQTAFLKTAWAEINRSITPSQASKQLTEVAETCIDLILQSLAPDAPMAVIAYGNAGAHTMHYASDLDCVFLHAHDSQIKDIAKIAQRLISMIQLPLPGGRLFEIDTRLRPNGRAGLLVSDIEQFDHYQRHEAWLWEHQALIRARWVAGDCSLRSAFDATRKAILTQARNPSEVAQSLREMRSKQQSERIETPIKRRLNDLQFASELGVLTQAYRNQQLIEARAPDQQLPLLEGLDASLKQALLDIWYTLNEALHHQWLDRQPKIMNEETLAKMDSVIEKAWQALAP